MLRGLRPPSAPRRPRRPQPRPARSPASTKPSRSEVVALTTQSASQTWSRPQLVASVAIIAVGATLGVGLDPTAAGLNVAGAATPVAADDADRPHDHGQGHCQGHAVHPGGDLRPPRRPARHRAGEHRPERCARPRARDGREHRPHQPREGRGSLEVPVVGGSIDGWCSVVGHRQMGMVFNVKATAGRRGAEVASGTSATHGGHASSRDPAPRSTSWRSGERAQRHTTPSCLPSPTRRCAASR